MGTSLSYTAGARADCAGLNALITHVPDHAGKTDDRRKIWTVYSCLTWYDVYFVHDGEKPDVIAIA